MTIAETLRSAGITRVLVVDDDLTEVTSLADLDATGIEPKPSEAFADNDHEFTVEVDELLSRLGLAHSNARERVQSLNDPDVLKQAAPLEHVGSWIQGAFDRASERRKRARDPLDKVMEWLTNDFKFKPESWSAPRELRGDERFDLLIIDYYLVDERYEATIDLIKTFKRVHESEDHPLLVILMSSNVDRLHSEFEKIRDACRMSASRFRILAKPVDASDRVDREKWIRAVVGLAKERPLVKKIEQFVSSWESSLTEATERIVQRLHDLDASAIAMLIETAKLDNMSFEEYLCDVLARRVAAEAESNNFPFVEIQQLEVALPGSGVQAALDQGVEVRHGQRAIRCLMGDVLWHRAEWWRPTTPIPPQVLGIQDDAASAIAASNANVERYKWMKRFIRFGTVFRRIDDGALFLNITQACDVQSVAIDKACNVNFLFLRGERFPIDKVTEGEKSYDSPYHYEDLNSDEFFTIQWQLRRASTPSLLEITDSLEQYEIVAQLRMDAAYAVLTKFVSQASRVALIRLPSLYRCSIDLFTKDGNAWTVNALTVEATAWNKKGSDWRVQFSADASDTIQNRLTTFSMGQKEQLQNLLLDSAKIEAKSQASYHAKSVLDGALLLVRMDGRTEYDEGKFKTYLSTARDGNNAFAGNYALLLRGMPRLDG